MKSDRLSLNTGKRVKLQAKTSTLASLTLFIYTKTKPYTGTKPHSTYHSVKV